MLQLRPDTPPRYPYSTIACSSHLLFPFSYLRLQSAPPMCSMHDNIDTLTLLLLWQRWPLSPSFVPSLISSLAKICTIPTAYVEANVNTVGESGGQELKAGMVTQTVIDTGTCICMNTHICIISEKKWYEYTHIPCAQTLSCCGAKDVHASRRRDRECHHWHLCALSLWWKQHAFVWDYVRVCVALNGVLVFSFLWIAMSHLISWQEGKGGINSLSELCSSTAVIHNSLGSLLERTGPMNLSIYKGGGICSVHEQQISTEMSHKCILNTVWLIGPS